MALLHNAIEYSPYSNLLKTRYRQSTGYVKPPRLPDTQASLLYTTDGKEKVVLTVSPE